jgi:KDO transferase-3
MEVVQQKKPHALPGFSVLEFDKCKNIIEGAVFIIASGSSAKDFPIEDFSAVPMITMNGAISMFVDTQIKPFFYACTDKSFSIQQPDLFSYAMEVSQRVALWEDHLWSADAKPEGDAYLLRKAPRSKWTDSFFRTNSDLIRNRTPWNGRSKSIGFSKHLKYGFFDARTVAYLALQIAYHSGFSQVFLVGFDLNQNAGRFYENEKSIASPCGLDQHYHSRILPSLKLMAERVIDHQFAVYNLSSVSRVPTSIIPFKSLAEVHSMISTQ